MLHDILIIIYVHIHIYSNIAYYCVINFVTYCLDETLYQPGTVRLAGGDNELSGRVEIYWNGIWGTVCDDFWTLPDARVVCRQLGYRDARQATRNAFHGAGNGIIWLDNVFCLGNETELQDCVSNGFGNHNCVHDEDAGVVCTSKLFVNHFNHISILNVYFICRHFSIYYCIGKGTRRNSALQWSY